MHVRFAASLAIALAASCQATAPTDTEGVCSQPVNGQPVDDNRDLDVLFVIDNSGSMGEIQRSFASGFGGFVSVLQTMDGGLPSIHVGVVSTDMGAIGSCGVAGDGGALQSIPRDSNCTAPAGAFISDVALADGTRSRNYTGSLADTFSCIANLGTGGCGFEQPLESMRRALDGSNTINAGFLRERAALLVVIVSDEDDCSARDPYAFHPSGGTPSPSSFRCFEYGVICEADEPRTPGSKNNCRPRESSEHLRGVDEYVQFLESIKSDPAMVAVATIVGNPDPVVIGADDAGNPFLESSCGSVNGRAIPAVRLAAFADAFQHRGKLHTICRDDLSSALVSTAQDIAQLISNPCVAAD